jgi:hypothetical protein
VITGSCFKNEKIQKMGDVLPTLYTANAPLPGRCCCVN